MRGLRQFVLEDFDNLPNRFQFQVGAVHQEILITVQHRTGCFQPDFDELVEDPRIDFIREFFQFHVIRSVFFVAVYVDFVVRQQSSQLDVVAAFTDGS